MHNVSRVLLVFIALMNMVFADDDLSSNGVKSTIPYVPKNLVAIDGRFDFQEWHQALGFDIEIETYPRKNAVSDVKTKAYIMHDGENLLVAFKAFHPDPKNIRAFYGDRDKLTDNDAVGVIINPFADGKLAYEFDANALGVQTDYTMSESSGKNYYEWDAIWNSAGQITDYGYSVEFSIPFHSMTLANDERQTWKIDLIRYHNDDASRSIAILPWDRDNDCYVCQITEVEIYLENNVSKTKHFELTPVLVMNKSNNRTVASDWQSEGEDYEGSLDFRWDISSENRLYGTYNPDFSHVEADEAILDVNENFTLFIPEKRYFFLKNINYFLTHKKLLHTRTVAAPDYGFNFTGKTGPSTYGLMFSRDAITTLIIPSDRYSSYDVYTNEQGENIENNVMVGRYKFDYSDRLMVGGFFSSRGSGDYENNLFSIDSAYRISKSNRINVQFMNSSSLYPESIQTNYNQEARLNDTSVVVDFDHRSSNWYGNIFYEDIGKDFRADSGFIPRVGYDYWSAYLERQWHNSEKGMWSRYSISAFSAIRHDVMGRVLGKDNILFSDIQIKYQTNLGIRFGTEDELHLDQSGQDYLYYKKYITFYANSKPTNDLSIWLDVRIGDEIDYNNNRLADGKTYEFGGSKGFGRHIRLESSFRFNELTVNRGQVYDARSLDMRFIYQMNIRSFIRLVYIKYDIDRNLSLFSDPGAYTDKDKTQARQILYSYKINPQTLFFAGYSDSAYFDEGIGGLFKDKKSLFMKLSYAFQY